MNSDAMEKPVADQSANNANSHVADETESVSSDNLAREPSGNDPDDQNYNESDICPFVLIRGRSDTLQRIWAGNKIGNP